MTLKEINSAIMPIMVNYTFRKKKNLFYRIRNHLAFCVELEKPSSIIYLHYYIMPLYIPCTTRYFTYGNRITTHCSTTTEQNPSEAAINFDSAALKQIIERIQQTIVPLFEQFSSPQKIAEFASHKKVHNTFSCTEFDLLRLQFFTYAFTGDKELFAMVRKKYFQALNKAKYLTDSVKENRLMEINTIDFNTQEGNRELQNWFEETIHNTIKVSSF